MPAPTDSVCLRLGEKNLAGLALVAPEAGVDGPANTSSLIRLCVYHCLSSLSRGEAVGRIRVAPATRDRLKRVLAPEKAAPVHDDTPRRARQTEESR